MTTTAKTASSRGGIGFAGMLTILFIGLKLTHYIDWSWVWVLAPLWIGIALFFGILMIIGIVMAIVAGVQVLASRQRAR